MSVSEDSRANLLTQLREANEEFVFSGLGTGQTTDGDNAARRAIAESREVQEGAERARKSARGLKTVARADQECRSVVDLRKVLDLSIGLASNEISHRARLVKVYETTPLVELDAALLGQVFINLLVNAAQAIPDGGESQEIRVKTLTDEARRAVIEVSDTGPGIPPEMILHIFDPLVATRPVGGDTQLGLSICHDIVTGMGGEISVTSRVGHGTTFRVALPAANRVLPPETPVVSAVKPEPGRAVVLIVDDEPTIGAMLGRALRGHDVTIVSSVKDAIAQLDSGREFDVILSDLMMPVASGMDLHDVLARRYPGAAERMVFVSGGAFTPAAHAFLDRVSNERIEKPFHVTEVRALVERFIRSS